MARNAVRCASYWALGLPRFRETRSGKVVEARPQSLADLNWVSRSTTTWPTGAWSICLNRNPQERFAGIGSLLDYFWPGSVVALDDYIWRTNSGAEFA